MDYEQMKSEKDARFKEYSEKYADQLRLQGYINSLEKDNEPLYNAKPTTFLGRRRLKKLIKINDKDIKRYKKELSRMPELPPFK